MRKKLIRTLTFIFGLYFILEFLLPKEIGGDFDKSGVRSPSVLYDAESGEYRLYYVGIYNRRNQAVGLATSSDGITWEKSAGNPVVRTTLFNSVDRLGFASLSPIKTQDGYELYYLGSDIDTPPHQTICWATSTDGVAWEKHGRLQFQGDIPWRQQDEVEESVLKRKTRYTKLQAIVATTIEDRVLLFIAHMNLEGKTEVLTAERPGSGLEWVVKSEPIPLKGIPELQKIVSLSYVEKGGVPELWMLFADKTLYRASLAPDGVAEKIAFAIKADEAKAAEGTEVETTDVLPDTFNEVTITASEAGYRMWYTRVGYGQGAEEPGEKAHVFSAASRDGLIWYIIEEKPLTFQFLHLTLAFPVAEEPPLFSAGTRAQPTYFSRGTVFAGQFLMIIGAFAIGLGSVNMCIVHGRNIIKTRKDIHNSVIFFIFLVSMFTATMYGKPVMDEIREKEATSGQSEEAKQEAVKEVTEKHSALLMILAKMYDFLFYHVQRNLGATVFSLVSFYMVGAAFRSFRVKSAEAAFLILSATIVLLGQIPLGFAISSYLPKASGILLNLFNAAAYRGVILGMAIAAISTSLRLWLGLEKGMFHGT